MGTNTPGKRKLTGKGVNTTPVPKKRTPVIRKRKASKDEIQERQQKVLQLRLAGLSYKAIAKSLNIGPMTVQRDLRAVRQENEEKVSAFDKEQVLGTALLNYDKIIQEAWEQYYSCANGTEGRSRFLNLVRNAQNDHVKMLIEVGLISKEPQKIEHTVQHKAVLESWSEDTKQVMAMAIVKSMLAPGKDPIPEIPETTTAIEAEATLVSEDNREECREEESD
jgi:hypothetical protein